ncbi:hypothetical protein E0494_04570 [Marinilabiliaceae bacterium JC040]|nr:hypothetical protein [Marinilabiliaceae bacterium JC040]
MDISSFFSNIKEEINVNKKFRKQYGSLLSPDFYALDLFKIDENKVSDVIAFFLDPNETHGQGDKFLKIFLKKIGLLGYLSEVTDVSVVREQSTKENRRIDIVIYFENNGRVNKALGIENKIYLNTKDQENQMNHYLEYLKNDVCDYFENNDYCLLYLAPKGKKISEISMSKEDCKKNEENNTLKCINYSDLIIPIFKEFQLVCESERLRYFLKEVELYFNKKFKGELYMNDTKNIKEIIKGDFESALAVYNNIEEAMEDLQEQLNNKMASLCENKEGEIISSDINEFTFKPSNWNNYRIGFAFEGNYFYYGILVLNNNIESKRFETIVKHNTLKKYYWDSSSYWPEHKVVNENIFTDYEFWNKMKNGEIYNEVEEFFNIILDEFNTETFVKKADI